MCVCILDIGLDVNFDDFIQIRSNADGECSIHSKH